MKRATDLERLPTEVVLEAAKLSDPEARFLVTSYYAAQDQRKAADMQIRHIGDKHLPRVLQYYADSNAKIEQQVTRALHTYAASKPVGQWMLAIDGIGPVISAGYLAHLTITHRDKVTTDEVPTMTVGHWWSFAGLDPGAKWHKGQKRPWNAQLKQLGFHCGECFKRVSNLPQAYYGHIYRARKEFVVARNERGHYAERAKTFVTTSAEVKKLLAEGKLPAINLDRQACNYAVKIFLSHLHALWFWHQYNTVPPKPFAITHLGHTDLYRAPNTEELFPGFAAAYYGEVSRHLGQERTESASRATGMERKGSAASKRKKA